ncbi:hypothetical protein BDF20DRAFT_909056 [Mycotypha africana]|uniref:uncharacterized protein n=1 Tax=Mycotypha africana TaxID=64632 RepID=UPI002300CF2B|nr:uncharacterized protein BDF20DRAFT_909056 [Mycotypha africana]KAI8991248.1 hypothetical protein BDF20DRAFT_909056 [Mycotypha africana]
MGVQGLWSLVGPAARPTPLESLRRKKLAVDASIWIHQFMRTMRDKEGNALRNGHLLGFFRRLCKLLFFDIKPVFVFDGGAPFLKRSTIKERRKRREGLKANLKVTARKIFNAQVRSRMLLQHEKNLQSTEEKTSHDTTEEENYVYVEELEQKAAVETLRSKRKVDQYELPELDTHRETYAKITKNNTLDPRLATKEEIQDFVNDFAPSISAMDIDNEAFEALPLEVQYEVIQDLKWKSRSTSHARLEDMVRKSETALDFSKQQIQNLEHRNKMTQRMMQISGMAHLVEPTRVASERGRQYILYKNENIQEGLGWKLPGLDALTPVELDSTTDAEEENDLEKAEEFENIHNGSAVSERREPKLFIPAASEFSTSNTENIPQQDKVAAALSTKPELAALLNGILTSDEDEREETESSSSDEEPLFISEANDNASDKLPASMFQPQQQQTNDDTINDMEMYMRDHNDAVKKQVLTRMYSGEQNDLLLGNRQSQYSRAQPITTLDINEEQSYADAFASLTAQQLYELWLARAPDSFIYLNSMNDAYKSILRSIIEEESITELEAKLKSVRRQRSKTNADHDMTLEALKFEAYFIEDVIAWRNMQNGKMAAAPISISSTDDENDHFEDITIEQQQQGNAASVSSHPSVAESVSSVVLADQNKVGDKKDLTSANNTNQIESTVTMFNTEPPDDLMAISDDMIITDDEEEENIQFSEVPVAKKTSYITNDVNDTKNKSTFPCAEQDSQMQHVQIDIKQSTLFKRDTELTYTQHLQPTEKQDEVLNLPKQTTIKTVESVYSTKGDANADMPTSKVTTSDKDTSAATNECTTADEDNTSHIVQPNDPTQSGLSSNNEEKIDITLKEEKVEDGRKETTNTTTSTTTVAEGDENEIVFAEEQGYNSEEELVNTMQGEEAEYLRFVSDIATKHLDDIKKDLQREVKELNALQRKTMGNTDDITDQMVQDTQELLTLFGIPYIIAPMEAEAQCAKLEDLNLVDGTITDDSDVFLFGAKRVYKNMFNQQKYVECYLSQDVEREMQLTRKRLIQLAFLLGSDYTEGIPGVGPVAAMEILNEFDTDNKDEDEKEDEPLEEPLIRFKEWYESNKDETPFQRRFRKRHNALDIPNDFPNSAVTKAYYHPTVDDATDQFVWGQPQLDSLRVFLMESFSWSEEKTDQVLLPVLREMNSRKTTGEQSVITAHFGTAGRIISTSNTAKHSSKRLSVSLFISLA